jgi:hypoxanthine-guanine phosphoribosyltransferase
MWQRGNAVIGVVVLTEVDHEVSVEEEGVIEFMMTLEVVLVEVVILVIEVDEVAVVDFQILVETGVVMATLKRVVEDVAGNGIMVVEEVMEADPGLTLVETEDNILMNLKNPLQMWLQGQNYSCSLEQ